MIFSVSFTVLLYSLGAIGVLFVGFADDNLLKNTLVDPKTLNIKNFCLIGVWDGFVVCLFVCLFLESNILNLLLTSSLEAPFLRITVVLFGKC